MKSLPWILLVIVLLGFIGFVGYSYGRDQKSTAPTAAQTANTATMQISPTTKIVPTTDPLANWKELTNASPKYSLKYQSDVNLTTENDGSKHFLKTGVVDLNLKSGPLDGKTIKEFADTKAAQMGGVFETSPVSAATLSKFSGYKFHVKGYAEGDYYYLDLGTNSYLEIFDASKDTATAMQILATLGQ